MCIRDSIETNQSWGIRYLTAPDAGVLLRHPTQIYEIVFHLSFAIIVWSTTQRQSDRSLMQGNWMPVYLIAYAVYRFASEFLRPELRIAGGLTFYQWSSIVIGFGFAALLATRFRRGVAIAK